MLGNAVDWNEFFNGLLVLVLGVLGWVAAKKGFKDGTSPPETVAHSTPPLTGTTVTTTTFTDDADIQAVKQLTGEISGVAYATTEQSEATKALTKAVDKGSDRIEEAVNDLTEQVRELRQVLSQRR